MPRAGSGALRPSDKAPTRAWSVAGALSLALSVASVLMALGFGRPWELRRPPALQPYALEGTPVTLSLPERPRVDVSGALIGERWRVGSACSGGSD